ncbi:MAG: hypothetical protein UT33_C0011G0156 [Candidatus Peregrinibacteria bacterium GW2011_GWC2_39_14]|nr:MAG: hypothetical protein UT33_C0011G0156 [Candidatus Peregrinibacteria bacterium GW2011_GWC2_39_14]
MSKKVEEVSSAEAILRKFGQGILKFSEILFKFMLNLVRLLPRLLTAVMWFLLVLVSIAFVGMILAYLTFSVIGLKDSPNFQAYRETIINQLLNDNDCTPVIEVSTKTESGLIK